MLYFYLLSAVPASGLFCLLFIPNMQISHLSKFLAITELQQATFALMYVSVLRFIFKVHIEGIPHSNVL